MKKYLKYLIIPIITIAIISGAIIFFSLNKEQKISSVTQCQAKEMIFYYSDSCDWCQKVKNEGTITKIKELGVKVREINTAVGPIRHKFQDVPTFVINDKVYSGYKTFDELKELLGCLNKKNNGKTLSFSSNFDFLGEKGETVVLGDGKIKLDTQQFNDNQARFYNINMSNNKTIYFFVVKDKNGIYRAAANACAVCFKTYKGFRHEGDEIVCNNCGNRYPIEKIATEKGGCNPGPINPNLSTQGGQIIIEQADIEQVADLF